MQEPGTASVVVASFETSRAAERMVASLGRGFRKKARSGNAAAFVVTRNRDGSFKLVQSRVLTAGGLVAAATTFTAAILAGLMGMMSALRGAKTVAHELRARESHVGVGDQRLTEIFGQVGPRGAVVLIHCMDEPTGETVADRAAERGNDSWHGSRTAFLTALDRLGDNYDWMRPAVAEPTPQRSRKRSG